MNLPAALTLHPEVRVIAAALIVALVFFGLVFAFGGFPRDDDD